MTMADVAQPREGDVPRDDDVAEDREGRTTTTMTMTLVADGFVGLRQAQAAAETAARQLRGVLPYPVRVDGATTVFSDQTGDYPDIATASQLPQPENAGPLAAAATPQPAPPPAPVAPLNVEEARGGLPDANLGDVDELPTPVPGIGSVVGGANASTLPSSGTQTAGGAGRSEEGAVGPDEVGYESWTVAELKTRASELDIAGRSGMSKAELIEAIEDAEG